MTHTTASILGLLGLVATGAALAAPDIEVNYPVLETEPVLVNETGHLQDFVRIFNRGTTDLHIGNVGVANPSEAPFSVGTQCTNKTLAPSATCELTVEEYMGNIGSFAGDFDIQSDDPDQPVLIVITHGRVAERFLEGRVDGIGAPATLRCENGDTGQAVEQELADTSRWDCFAAGLDASYLDRIKITLSGPAEADTIEYAPLVALRIVGTGVDAVSPNLIVDPMLINMGRVSVIQPEGGGGPHVTNNNAFPIHFSEVATTNPLAEPFFVVVDRLSHSTCNPGADCESGAQLDIGLRTSTPGVYHDSFSITSDDPVNPQVTVHVVGEVVENTLTGSVMGLRNEREPRVNCWNQTTHQRFRTESREWNCTKFGLHASAGDMIQMTVSGRKEQD